MTELEHLTARAAGMAMALITSDGECLPTWFIVLPSGKTIVHRTAWRDHGDKMRWLNAMKFGMHAMNAERYVLVSESWMVTCETEDEARTRAAAGIENNPDRVEVISIIGEDVNDTFVNAFIPIIRHGDGEPVSFGKIEGSGEYHESRFLGLLPRRGTPQ